MDAREKLIAWLNDAHAMEQALVETLERHAQDAKDDPQVKARIEQHVEETREQAETVRGCIESLGGEVSGAKEVFGKMFGAMQGMMNRPMGDTMVKNALADYATEHYEIACYRALIEASTQLGETAVATQLGTILEQEVAMAQFLEHALPGAIQHALRAAE